MTLAVRCWRKIVREFRRRRLMARISHPSLSARVEFRDPYQPVVVEMAPAARFILNGVLRLNSFQGLKEAIFIGLGRNSKLHIDGDFELGPGVRIWVDDDAELYIGGCRKESSSGITERTRIMVHRKVHIGVDFVCSWGSFITDCDWHEMIGSSVAEDTVIGDHVWITPNCSILKGSRIGNECVVATGSVIQRECFPDYSLIGGVPARVLASNRRWQRDFSPAADPGKSGPSI